MSSTPSSNRITVEAAAHPVRRVTVYSDRAEVSRDVRGVKVARNGTTDVWLRGVTTGLDQDTLRVEIARGRALIADVRAECEVELVRAAANGVQEQVPESELDAQTAARDARIKARKAELESLTEAVEDLREDLAIATDRLALADAFAARAAKDQTPFLSASGPLEAAATSFFGTFSGDYGKAAASLGASRVRLERAIADHDARIDALRDAIAAEEYRPNSDADAAHRTIQYIKVALEGPGDAEAKDGDKEVEVDLVVTYVVRNASWAPRYDMRVYSADSLVRLTYAATLKQSTTEAWNNVELTLSTASVAAIDHTLPKFASAWVVDEYRPPPPVCYAAMVTCAAPMMESVTIMSDMAAPRMYGAPPPPPLAKSARVQSAPRAPPPKPQLPQAAVTSGMTATSYRIPSAATIPSDGEDHRVTVAVLDLPLTMAREAAPKLSTKVYLTGKAENASAYTLLPGSANVFLDGSFIAKSECGLVLPSGTLSLALGVDPTIEVSLKPVEKVTEVGAAKKTGIAMFTGGGSSNSAAAPAPGGTSIVHTQRIVVTNRRAAPPANAAAGESAATTAVVPEPPVIVKLAHQIPSSTHQEIAVVLLEPDEKAVVVRASKHDTAGSGADAQPPSLTRIGTATKRSRESVFFGGAKRDKAGGSKSGSLSDLAAAALDRVPVLTRDTGVLEWELGLAGGQTRELVCKFAVVYPKDVKVDGLNRA
ncbi:hypothetical protein H9P43_008166 [Blastocladiella emersonii ATCC 22665]|nr:hypothetical protein H9P43_008166 [Blastocladiella emersonii ATCC 22665]